MKLYKKDGSEIDVITLDMLKEFNNIQVAEGQGSYAQDNVFELCKINLKKGFLYEIITVVNQEVSNQNAINNYINGSNCNVTYKKTIGYAESGGGVMNHAYVEVKDDNAYVSCSTYSYDSNIVYKGYMKAKKIGIL